MHLQISKTSRKIKDFLDMNSHVVRYLRKMRSVFEGPRETFQGSSGIFSTFSASSGSQVSD